MNKCEGRPLSLPLAVVSLSLGFFFLRPARSGSQVVCRIVVRLPLTAADVTAGPFNGQRDKSFIWRSTSPPPRFAFLAVVWKAC